MYFVINFREKAHIFQNSGEKNWNLAANPVLPVQQLTLWGE